MNSPGIPTKLVWKILMVFAIAILFTFHILLNLYITSFSVSNFPLKVVYIICNAIRFLKAFTKLKLAKSGDETGHKLNSRETILIKLLPLMKTGFYIFTCTSTVIFFLLAKVCCYMQLSGIIAVEWGLCSALSITWSLQPGPNSVYTVRF